MAQTHATNIASTDHGSSERVRPQYDDINVTVVVMVGIISAIVTFLIVVAVQGMAYRMEDTFLRAANSEFRKDVAAETVAAQKALLDGGEGGAKVPIEKAMELVVGKYSKGGTSEPAVGSAGSHGEAGTSDGH
jgi:hypothetical protein